MRVFVALAAAALSLIAAPATADTRGVKVKDNFFSPVPKTAAPGDTIRFKWSGENPHSVKFTKVPRGAGKPASCKIKVEGRCKRKLKKAGTYRYKCTIHGDAADRMRGRIVVD